MKRWLRVFIISAFAFAAVGLVILQFYQTRRTVSINDNMFNIGVSHAMDEVIDQLNGESGGADSPVIPVRFQELDSLISASLLLNGIDINPIVGLYDESQHSFLYSSDPQHENDLEESPYRYSFQPKDILSNSQLFILLSFPSAQLFLQRNSGLLAYMSLVLILIIIVLFVISLRTISNQRVSQLIWSSMIPPFRAPKQPKASPLKSTVGCDSAAADGTHSVTIVSGQCTIGVSTKFSVWLPSSMESAFLTSTVPSSMP
jgi:hypothetical protein